MPYSFTCIRLICTQAVTLSVGCVGAIVGPWQRLLAVGRGRCRYWAASLMQCDNYQGCLGHRDRQAEAAQNEHALALTHTLTHMHTHLNVHVQSRMYTKEHSSTHTHTHTSNICTLTFMSVLFCVGCFMLPMG